MDKVNILLVDDYPENLLALEAILSNMGHNLVKANSGEQALRHLLHQDFAVILLDVHMAGLDGFETAALIRERERSKHTPIIFLTAFDKDGSLVSKGYLVGAVDYLIKPIVPEILKAKVKVFIDLFIKTQALSQQLEEIEQLNHSVSKYKRATQERQRMLVQEHAARNRAEAMQQRMAFLAEASAVLGASLDYEMTLKNLASLTVPSLGDLCLIDVFDDHGVLKRLAVSANDSKKEEILYSLAKLYPPDPNGIGSRGVLRSGEAMLIQEVPASVIEKAAQDDDHWAMLSELGVASVIIVPILVRKQCVGTITMIMSESGRVYDHEDLMLAEDLARRVSLTIENAWLYREAQRALDLRDEFLSVAAHELRTPITSLQGFAQLLMRQIDKQSGIDPGYLRKVIARLDQQSQKLAYLSAQLLDVSRVQAGQLKLDIQDVNVVDLIDNLVSSIQVTTNQHAIKLYSPADDIRVCVDPIRLEQVLTNLIGNAIKYSPDGGLIDVGINLPTPEFVSLSVKDCGIGIPAEHRHEIFAPFYQAHEGNPYGGMGLGLYISRQIVELHSGTIEAQFPLEGGTCIVVKLPIKPALN
jgi:signal transduction histidine kinase/DNA-binding response OmpR family regulator